MATFMKTDCVKFVFNNFEAPLCEWSFCRTCYELRSKRDVLHEVDSLYCPNCLESMPAAEAKARKNKCASCFDCPCCGHALSTRATLVMDDNPPQTDSGEPRTPRKAFYLSCSFCRWTSRDVGLKDMFVSSGGWPEKINPHASRITSLIDYYKQLSLKELQEKEKKRMRRKSFFQIQDKFGIGHMTAKRRAGLTFNLIKDQTEMNVAEIDESKASEDLEELPDHYYTQPIDLDKITSIQQRLADPEFQPSLSNQMYPSHKHLLIKKSQRCKQCEHNLSKPEFNPSAIKFKIQLLAIHHIPEIRIKTLPQLKINQPSQLVLTLNNPLEIPLFITLTPYNPSNQISCYGDVDQQEKDQISADDVTAQIILPDKEIQIAKNDESSEVEEISQTFEDDPKVIQFRKGNKIGFLATITPLKADTDAIVRITMKHNYLRKVVPITGEKDGKEGKDKEVEYKWLQHHLLLNFGPVSGHQGDGDK